MKSLQISDYNKALSIVKDMPQFYLGQEVLTKDGKGIIVHLRMQWNGLFLEPNTSEAVVWYSTESAANRTEGGNWVSFTYKLTELTIINKTSRLSALKRLISALGLKFNATQYKWGRSLYGGTWYYNYNWVTNPFWTDKIITSCGSQTLKTESYE